MHISYRWLLILGISTMLVGCGAAAPAAVPTTNPGTLVPVVAVSELTKGVNRLAFGVLKDGTPINDANLTLDLTLFYLDGPEPTKPQGSAQAVYRGEGLPFGLYVGYADLPQVGGWGVEIRVPQASGEPQVSRLRLDVLDTPRAPAIGSQAIPVDNLTVKTQPDLAQITSDSQPDVELYQLTVAEALAAKKPFLVAFSTPGYCQTAVCGPNMLVIKKLKDQLKDQVNFIHVEVYPYPFNESYQNQRRVRPIAQWKLQTEPWTFLVDANGIIQARYEGGITFSEMEPALAQLAAGQPVQLLPNN
jgi:hypothetical protein